MGILCDGENKIKCQRCDFSDIRALQIDHINGDGHLERKRNNGNNKKVYFSIAFRMNKEEAKKRYQVLCANCNQIKVYEDNQRGQIWKK